MEELIYFCVRIVCIGYLLYSVYGWRRRIETVCTLLYGKPCVKKEKKEVAGTESAVSDAEVMGSTRYVYLDENAGKTAAPFMSQPLERNFIGEEEDVQQEDVECNLQLDKMKLLQEVQEDLDAESPEVESVSPVLSSRDMEVLGEYLTALCILPEVLISKLSVPFVLGGTTLLIVVQVTMDFVTQVQSHLIAYQYEGLIKKAALVNKKRK